MVAWSMVGAKVGKVFAPEEMRPAWLRLLRCAAQQHPLPTQMVVRQPGFFVPSMAREYRTDLYAVRGPRGQSLMLSWNEAMASAMRVHGTDAYDVWRSKCKQVVLLEVWENVGEDGHIEQGLVGFVFAIAEEFAAALETSRGDYKAAVRTLIRG